MSDKSSKKWWLIPWKQWVKYPKTMRFWRAVGWLAFATLLIAAITYVYRLTWQLYSKFPPLDAITAWTMVAGVGALLTAAATAVLSSFALRGLLSLRLARIELKETAERSAKLMAIARLEEVAKELVPMNAELLDAIAATNVKTFIGPTDKVVFGEDEPKDLNPATAWKASLPPGISPQISHFLNRLEAWCVYFISGVADEEIAFEPIAPLLRAWVGQYYAVLLLARSKEKSGTFPNTVELFERWTARMDAPKLARMYQDVQKDLKRSNSTLEKKLPKYGTEG